MVTYCEKRESPGRRESMQKMVTHVVMTVSAMMMLAAGAWGMPGMAKEGAAAAVKEQASPANEALYITGKVVETMNAGGYTYMLLEKEGKKSWVAVPPAEVKVGDEVKVLPGMEMGTFTSKTLNRTFEGITFSGGLVGAQAKSAKNGAETAPPAKVDLGSIKVEKAAGENAYTVAELYGKSAELKGKKVVLKGKVVKVSKGIMGKNWIHLRDGSGDADTNNMVVTTQELASVGDTVTITGTLLKDKDFGGGYFYKVIVEDATLVR
jgi:hypothetical protein